jgi:hypothetical protein
MTVFDTPRRTDAVKRPGQMRVLGRNPGRVAVLVPCRRYVTIERVTESHSTQNIRGMTARWSESTRFPRSDFNASRDCDGFDDGLPHDAAMTRPDNVFLHDSQPGAAVPQIHSPGRLCHRFTAGAAVPQIRGQVGYRTASKPGAAVPHPIIGALHPSPLLN